MDSTPPIQRASVLRTSYETQLTEAECIAALQFNQARLMRKLPRSYLGSTLRALAVATWSASSALATWLIGGWLLAGDPGPSGLPGWLAFSVLAAMTSFTLAQLELRRRAFRGIAAQAVTHRDKRIITIEEGGLRSRSARGESWVPWNGIYSIEECDGQILVYLDGVSFISIPNGAFADPAERAEFLAELRRRVHSTGPPTALVIGDAKTVSVHSSEVSRPKIGSLATLYTHIRHGFRLAVFRRPTMDLGSSEESWSTLVALIFLSIALSFLGDRLVVGPKGYFSAIGLPGVLFGVPVAIVAAWAVARLAGHPRRTLTLITVMMSLLIPIGIAEVAFRLWWVKQQDRYLAEVIRVIFPIWFTVTSTAAAIRLLGTPRRRWPATCLLTGLLLGLPLTTIYRDRTLWWKSEPDEDEFVAKYRALASEDVFYLQPKLLEEQLTKIKVSRPGVIDLYFVGLAADAYQDVFMKEVQSMTKLFDERFDSAGRSLMLINNAATVRAAPIASVTSLGTALKRLSEIMDRNEDVLFLFVTSHGSKESGVEFEFSPLHLEQLAPKRLKELLDQYAIRRRVVVVSACYSGQFVDALKDDDTLVISASAADRNSFGCSNDADFTYFGKAYFEALQQTYSFSEAFELAKPVIASREREAHYRQSNPRISVGPNIKRALEDFVRQRESSAKRAAR